MAAEQKIHLIESMNPHWYDLAEAWADIHKPKPKIQEAVTAPQPYVQVVDRGSNPD